jgi:large subunit ribosomal protein L32
MAVPKKRTSKSRQRKRRAQIKLKIPNLINCPKCGEKKLPHSVCPSCGFYDSEMVVDVLAKLDKKERKKKEKEMKAKEKELQKK